MKVGQKYKVNYADFSKFEKGEIVTLIRGNHWSKFRFENNKGVVDDLYATDVEIHIEEKKIPINFLPCNSKTSPYEIDCQGKIIGMRDRFPHTDIIDNSHD
jgi:hypothetical protein